MNGLTVIIPCKNERRNLPACVASVWPIADNVLVADSGSTDGTIELAQKLGCQVVEREYRWSGDFKNWAIPQARDPWVLLLDADERLSAPLVDEIRRELARPKHDGYTMRRVNYFLGHPIRYGAWWPDRPLRLFRRDLGSFVGSNDHAEVRLRRGTVGRLKNAFTHFTCWTYEQYLPKVYRYATVQAQIWNAEGRRAHLGQLLFRGPLRFLQSYLLKLGFLDGLAGLQSSAMVGYQSYLKQARLWELQHARRREDVDDRQRDVSIEKIATECSAA